MSRPDRFDDLISRIEQYAETALDHGRAEHARRCYTMLAAIRWEGGAWSDAQRDTLRGELVSRSIDDCERVLAMAEASRCLAMLERDLGTAEELALEAEALARRLGNEPNAIFDALGLLSCYRGEYAEAARLFERARIIARRDGDRISEFVALEHLLTLRIEQGRMDEASHLCREAVDLAARLRPGSEAPFVRALHALCTGVGCADESFEEFDQALADLRAMDAKHRLAFVASAAAHLLLLRGNVARARALAEEALSAATILDRNSDIAVALSGLVRIETFARDEERRRMHEDRLVGLLSTGISKHAQDEAEAALASGAAELFGED